MRWKGNRRSTNVQDRRGQRVRRGGGISITTVIFALLAMWLFDINPMTFLGAASQGGASVTAERGHSPSRRTPSGGIQDEMGQFVSTVLADTEDVWGQLFRSAGARYRQPQLVLFTGATRTACGVGQQAMGPFYCPADETVYIDLSFYETMRRQLGAPGDFAQAYVIAHEVGHHIQKLMGTTDKMDAMRRRISKREYNQLSVRLELQADCFAGVWAHHAHNQRNILEHGDIEEAMNAAAAIGDDALQRRQQGHIVPDSFTHGTSQQRMRWFNTGLQTGNYNRCDTFSARQL